MNGQTVALPDAEKGTFSGTVDVVFDTNDLTANGTSVSDLDFHNGYTGAPSGDFSTPGMIDEGGASAFGGSGSMTTPSLVS